MKKALIIYVVFFALTILIPALACFVIKSGNSGNELVNIFRGGITLIECCCRFS